MTLEQINNLIELTATDNATIQRVFYGAPSDEDVADNKSYPALLNNVVPVDIVGGFAQERNSFPVELFIIDPIMNDPDEAQWKPKYEQLHTVATEIYMALKAAGDTDVYDFILTDASLTPVLHTENTSGVVGWSLSFTIQDAAVLDCEPYNGGELCLQITAATWAEIYACMSSEQISDATDALCGIPPTMCEQIDEATSQEVVDCIEDAGKTAAVQALICETPTCLPAKVYLEGVKIADVTDPCDSETYLNCDDLATVLIIEGAGSDFVNGTYLPTGNITNGQLIYYLDGDVNSYRVYWDGTVWQLVEVTGVSRYYFNSDVNPWSGTWTTVGSGVNPAPTSSQGTIGDICAIPCEDATVRNSDTTFTEDIPSGDTYVLEDYTFQFTDENDVVLATEVRPAMIGETFVVESYCPTEFSYNLNINGVFQEVVTVNINDDINITIE